MAVRPFNFTKEWTDPEDFATHESSEAAVRQDMQELHDQAKNYINQVVVPALNELEDGKQPLILVGHELPATAPEGTIFLLI